MRDLPAGQAGTGSERLIAIAQAPDGGIGGRALVLILVAVAGFLLYGAYRWWRAQGPPPVERLDVDLLGLEAMSAACAFIVFTTPTCRPCKAVLRVIDGAVADRPDFAFVTTIDAIEKADLAVRYVVRTVPTTFLITASGHVIRRWRDVPELDDVSAALAQIEAA